jgi:hypothetical protein
LRHPAHYKCSRSVHRYKQSVALTEFVDSTEKERSKEGNGALIAAITTFRGERDEIEQIAWNRTLLDLLFKF